MAHVLDANVFIEAKRRYYAHDFCPAFWDWLLKAHAHGDVSSIHAVRAEIARGGDALAKWVRAEGAAIFVPEDDMMVAQLPTVARWVEAHGYHAGAAAAWLDGADYYLVAHALGHGDIVVTHETPEPTQLRKVKIPDVCKALNVAWTNPWQMLRSLRARFVLER